MRMQRGRFYRPSSCQSLRPVSGSGCFLCRPAHFYRRSALMKEKVCRGLPTALNWKRRELKDSRRFCCIGRLFLVKHGAHLSCFFTVGHGFYVIDKNHIVYIIFGDKLINTVVVLWIFIEITVIHNINMLIMIHKEGESWHCRRIP